MRAGAELRIATDIGDYAGAILLAVRRKPSFPLDRKARRLARAGRRLAADALRGQGAARRPTLLLFLRFHAGVSALMRQPPATSFFTSRLPNAQFLPSICSLMIISTLRVGPWGPLFLFWAIA